MDIKSMLLVAGMASIFWFFCGAMLADIMGSTSAKYLAIVAAIVGTISFIMAAGL